MQALLRLAAGSPAPGTAADDWGTPGGGAGSSPGGTFYRSGSAGNFSPGSTGERVGSGPPSSSAANGGGGGLSRDFSTASVDGLANGPGSYRADGPLRAGQRADSGFFEEDAEWVFAEGAAGPGRGSVSGRVQRPPGSTQGDPGAPHGPSLR